MHYMIIINNIKVSLDTDLNDLYGILSSKFKINRQDILNAELNRTNVPILIETYKNGVNTGHSDNYIEYRVISDTDMTGSLINVNPLSTDGNVITAR